MRLPSGLIDPVLVSGTDGVGTKLKVAFAANKHDTIGIDLVAMCVNDVATCGAEPLFFLDYFATSKLDVGVAEAVIAGIAAGCRDAGCALLGGETAELPGMYSGGEYDLAGFCVGVIERAKIIDGKGTRAGDVLIGVASSGLHSNGYSLARRAVLEHAGLSLDAVPEGFGPEQTVARVLLEPTRIYARALRAAVAAGGVHAVAHITGGGIGGNVPRVLPAGLGAENLSAIWKQSVLMEYFLLGRNEGGGQVFHQWAARLLAASDERCEQRDVGSVARALDRRARIGAHHAQAQPETELGVL